MRTAALFGVGKIPSDNHIRDLLDEASPELLYPVFNQAFEAFQASPEKYRALNGTLLVGLDGTQYYSSDKTFCEKWSHRQTTKRKVTCFHGMINPVVVAPGGEGNGLSGAQSLSHR